MLALLPPRRISPMVTHRAAMARGKMLERNRGWFCSLPPIREVPDAAGQLAQIAVDLLESERQAKEPPDLLLGQGAGDAVAAQGGQLRLERGQRLDGRGQIGRRRAARQCRADPD